MLTSLIIGIILCLIFPKAMKIIITTLLILGVIVFFFTVGELNTVLQSVLIVVGLIIVAFVWIFIKGYYDNRKINEIFNPTTTFHQYNSDATVELTEEQKKQIFENPK